jgi:hypothetical protein
MLATVANGIHRTKGSSMKENGINKEDAHQMAVEFLKRRKLIEKVEVSTIEHKNEIWVIRGTCPIYLEGHPWAEKFELIMDSKGKVKSTDFALL